MKTSQKLREKIRQLQNQIRGQSQFGSQGVSLPIDQRRNPEPENLVSTTTSEVIPATRQVKDRRPSNTSSDVSSTAEDSRNLPIQSLVPGIFNPPPLTVTQRIAHEPKKRTEPKPKMAKEWSHLYQMIVNDVSH